MNCPSRPWALALTVACCTAGMPCFAADLPAGFQPLFNGQDLTGWYGLNPHGADKLTGDAKAANLAAQRADFAKHWRVENGELVNDGHGPYATTDGEFGDIELRLEYKTVAKADSGIYLRGVPQVQIWDWNQPFDPKNPHRKPHLGSGGLYNNSHGASGRDPLVFADKPFGEWNDVRIKQHGASTWVWLNDKLVVDGAVFENFWNRRQPFPVKGPVMLQTHGGEIRWRNIAVRELKAEEADALAAQRAANALTLHASFDEGLDADFARGDRTAYVRQDKELAKELVRATRSAELTPAVPGGRFGGALQFTKKTGPRPSYKNAGVLNYDPQSSWNSTVSVWLKLDPDRDLEPGYCDPVQIIGADVKKGFVFLEWSKDHTPRKFRYAIRPLFSIWNPTGVGWEEIPAAKRPMVEVERAGFSREAWTHVLFTLERINTEKPSGRLYLNGKLQGTIENWDLKFEWTPDQVLLVLGAAYIGQMDDLAVFKRALTDAEVQQVYGLKTGVRELYPPGASQAK